MVGCFIDLAAGSISFSVNGRSQGEAFSIPNHSKKSAFHPAICLRNAAVSVNFGGAGSKFAFPGEKIRPAGNVFDQFRRLAACESCVLARHSAMCWIQSV